MHLRLLYRHPCEGRGVTRPQLDSCLHRNDGSYELAYLKNIAPETIVTRSHCHLRLSSPLRRQGSTQHGSPNLSQIPVCTGMAIERKFRYKKGAFRRLLSFLSTITRQKRNLRLVAQLGYPSLVQLMDLPELRHA
ncbi:hypothetical protein VME0621_04288 [Vibrio mediterranei]|nr:hypothetical protein VME0621_04288 [Vibrio mediterranei]